MSSKLQILFSAFALLLLGFSIFSYSLTDPNLVLSTWPPYWQFQQWMWRTIFENSKLLSSTFAALIVLLFGCYGLILKELTNISNTSKKPYIMWFGVFVVVISLSYNALSHDVFNYMFNAKMISVYGENPHQVTALEFSQDDWTRFMHNTHTAAPYGYGWTAFSLIPFTLGLGKFISTWLIFRVIEIVAVVLLYFVLEWVSRLIYKRSLSVFEAAVLFLNPLFLVEIISSMHNDLWMMVPAVAAVGVALHSAHVPKKRWLFFAGSLVLLVASMSVKYATIVLVPVLFVIFLQHFLVHDFLAKKLSRAPYKEKITTWIMNWIDSFWKKYIPLLCSVLLFLPLLSPRSQFFHPWYLVWPLVWIPLVHNHWWRAVVITFSVSSLLRYIPWLLAGGFEEHTLTLQRSITWILPVILLAGYYFVRQHVLKKRTFFRIT